MSIDYEVGADGGERPVYKKRGFEKEEMDVVAEAWLWNDRMLTADFIREHTRGGVSPRRLLRKLVEGDEGADSGVFRMVRPGAFYIEELPGWVRVSEFHRQKRVFEY